MSGRSRREGRRGKSIAMRKWVSVSQSHGAGTHPFSLWAAGYPPTASPTALHKFLSPCVAVTELRVCLHRQLPQQRGDPGWKDEVLEMLLLPSPTQ